MKPHSEFRLEIFLRSAPIQSGTDHWDEAVDFLERLRPGGPWVLCAIVLEGPIRAHNSTGSKRRSAGRGAAR